MSDPLIRGAVLHCRGRYGVVWDAVGGFGRLLPLYRPQRSMAYDVELELGELMACGVPIAGAVVRPRMGDVVDLDGAGQVGTLPGPTMCRVVQGVVRVAAEAAHVEKYSGLGRYRERCVNLAGAVRAPSATQRVALRVPTGQPARG